MTAQNESQTDQVPDEGAAKQKRKLIPSVSLKGVFETHPLRGRRDLWQIPAVLVGVAMIALGLRAWVAGKAGPDFDGALDSAEQFISIQKYDEAMELLNGPILEHLNDPSVSTMIWGRFHSLRGDALFLGQRSKDLDVAENHNKILIEYKSARQYDPQALDGRRLGFFAETLIALGKSDEARSLLDEIPASDEQRRNAIVKRLIEGLIEGKPPKYSEAEQMLAQMRSRDLASPDLRRWVVVTQNRIRLELGHADRVIDELLVEVQRVPDQRSPEAADLFLLLGQAYLALGHLDQAHAQLSRAELAFPMGSPKIGAVHVGLGRIAQLQNEIEDARDRFALVVDQYRGTEVLGRAYLGLAETEAHLGRFPDSLSAYRTLVEMQEGADRRALKGVAREVVYESLVHRHSERATPGDHRTAQDFALVAERLYRDGQHPDELLLTIGETKRQLGSLLLGIDPSDIDAAVDFVALDSVTLEEARVLLMQAGEYFHRHAKSVVVMDAEGAGESLWLAADSYERAGDLGQAVKFFKDFLQTQSGHPRATVARYRMARVHQALGELDSAIDEFSKVVSENPTSDPASRSFVPLAQTYITRGAEGDLDQAREVLTRVLTGTVFQPESRQFREALTQLGRLHRRMGSFPEAIERLTETLERYPEIEDIEQIRFDLADSYRESAGEIDVKLEEAMPQSERAHLQQLRRSRLAHALDLYDEVRRGLEARDPTTLSAFESEMLRNATFYRGDCAFDLTDYESAITYYDTAAQRYAGEAASLVAMVQIVNCYMYLDKVREAKTAHERARTRLEELPDEIWQTPDMPMDRRYWERWLESSERLAAAGV